MFNTPTIRVFTCLIFMKFILKNLQIIVLTFFFVGAPLVSWYYLRSGMMYRKERLSDLKKIGKIDVNQITFLNPENKDSIDSKVIVVVKADQNNVLDPNSTIAKIYSQFKEVPTFRLLLLDSLIPTSKLPNNIIQIKEINNPIIAKIITQNMGFLINMKNEIVNQYDLNDKIKVEGMIEHIAMIMPLKSTKEVIERKVNEK
jgi:hypothetical protein